MENTPVQLAIREMKQQASSPRFWIRLLCVVGILTVAAPFNTGEQLNNVQRFFYWLCIAVSTYFAAIFILQLVCAYFQAAGKSELLARVVGSVLAGKHIVEQKRIHNKPHLLLSDDSAVPVSRTYSAAVKAALAANRSS